MGKSSPSPPPAPDYAGAAAAQGAANVETARLQGRINNPNIIGPLGGQTVTFNANDQPTVTQTLTPASQATLDAQQRVQRSLAGLGEQGVGTAQTVLRRAFNPNLSGLQTTVGDAGQIPQTPNLSSYGQASGNLGNDRFGLQSMGGKSQIPPAFDALYTPDGNQQLKGQETRTTGFPSQDRMLQNGTGVSGFNPQPAPMLDNARQNPQAPELSVYGMAGAGPQAGQYGYAGGLNTSNIAAMPVNAGMTGQQAIMNRLAPQLELSDAAMRQRLINQGLVPGGEAYENAMISQNQQKNDLLSQAALQGIGLDTAANAQGFNQALQAGQYGNQAIAQNFGQGQAANAAGNQAVNQNQQAALAQYQAQLGGQQQGFGQNVTQRQLGNQAISQNQQAALQQQQAALAAQNQQYNQLLQGAQFGNTAQQQSLQQQLALRNQPLNEIAGLMSGSQIQMPQFQGYQGANVAGTPIMQGAMAQGQAAMDQYGIQSANANAQNAGLYGMLGTAGGLAGMKYFSDRRLKSNIDRIGTHPLGIGVYEYDIFDRRERGLMADEVEAVMPEAVMLHPSGYKMVDYGMLT